MSSSPFEFTRCGLAYWQAEGGVERLVLELDGERFLVRCGPGALGYHAQREGFRVASMDSLRPGRRALSVKDWAQFARGMARGLLDAQKAAAYNPPQLLAA